MERLKSKRWIRVCGILTIFAWVDGFVFERVKFAVLADPHLRMAVEGIKDEFKMIVSS